MPTDVRIDLLDTSTSTLVGSGIDPEARAAFLAGQGEAPPPAPKFKESATVYHRASGKRAVVLAQVVRCSNPAHTALHAQGAYAGGLPDCALLFTGFYMVSTDFGDELMAAEAELVETASDPTRGTLTP